MALVGGQGVQRRNRQIDKKKDRIKGNLHLDISFKVDCFESFWLLKALADNMIKDPSSFDILFIGSKSDYCLHLSLTH